MRIVIVSGSGRDGRLALTGQCDLRTLVTYWFGDMVEYVVDVERGRIAIGRELHADAEHVLLEAGSLQRDLWGANYNPGRGRDGCLEFTSLSSISVQHGGTVAWRSPTPRFADGSAS